MVADAYVAWIPRSIDDIREFDFLWIPHHRFPSAI